MYYGNLESFTIKKKKGIEVRKKLIAGNWKMNKTLGESVELVEGILGKIREYDDRDVLFCPPFTSLYKVSQLIKGKNVKLGGQNLYFEEKGAYTGEISAKMLKSVGCECVILGHSERRNVFGEADELIRKKVIRAKEEGLISLQHLQKFNEYWEEEEGTTTKPGKTRTSGGFEY